MFTKDDLIRECGPHLPKAEREEAWGALTEKSVVSIRLHPIKYTSVEFELTNPVPWSDRGYYLDKRPVFTLDPAFHAGEYYVQEASSMVVGQVAGELLKEFSDPLIFDASAAPGGKSTHLLEMMNGSGLLVCNEPDGARIRTLKSNLTKSGYSNVLITKNFAERLSSVENYFDIILFDAPCSASGMFRKNPDWLKQWKPEKALRFSRLQKNILQCLSHLLKPGGYLIFSTCSFSVCENEENAEALKDLGFELMHQKLLSGLKDFGVYFNEFGARFYPHRLKGEGFFITIGKKIKGEKNRNFLTKKNKTKTAFHMKVSAENKNIFFINHEHSQNCFYLRKEYMEKILELKEAGFNFIAPGIFLGTKTRFGFVPSQEYVMLNHPLVFEELRIESIPLTKSDVIYILKNKQWPHTSFLAGNPIPGFYKLTYGKNGICLLEVQANGKKRIYLDDEFRIKNTNLKES
ncbi:MAG: RsmB/NOP family class I SAM-dependent RNA methyltransferase [Bacteroidia bacterium]|nr:RsmB/NOP family class I SAM-dependent RNA methyltransferase [Bacteroidia bacterium]